MVSLNRCDSIFLLRCATRTHVEGGRCNDLSRMY